MGAMTVSAGDEVGAPCPNQFGQRGGEERGARGVGIGLLPIQIGGRGDEGGKGIGLGFGQVSG